MSQRETVSDTEVDHFMLNYMIVSTCNTATLCYADIYLLSILLIGYC